MIELQRINENVLHVSNDYGVTARIFANDGIALEKEAVTQLETTFALFMASRYGYDELGVGLVMLAIARKHDRQTRVSVGAKSSPGSGGEFHED